MSTEYPASRHQREPWNKGRLVGQKRPLNPKDVWTIRVRLQMEKRRRDLAMFNLAIDSKLRGCDLVRLKIDDVCASGRVRDRTTVVQKKTGRPVQFEITEQTRAAVGDCLAGLGDGKGRYLFPSRFRERASGAAVPGRQGYAESAPFRRAFHVLTTRTHLETLGIAGRHLPLIESDLGTRRHWQMQGQRLP
jgi:integrase